MLLGFCFFPLNFLSHSLVNLVTPLLGLIQQLHMCLEFSLVLSLSLRLLGYFCLSVVSSARFGVYVVEPVLLALSRPSISLCQPSVSQISLSSYVQQSTISPRTSFQLSQPFVPGSRSPQLSALLQTAVSSTVLFGFCSFLLS